MTRRIDNQRDEDATLDQVAEAQRASARAIGALGVGSESADFEGFDAGLDETRGRNPVRPDRQVRPYPRADGGFEAWLLDAVGRLCGDEISTMALVRAEHALDMALLDADTEVKRVSPERHDDVWASRESVRDARALWGQDETRGAAWTPISAAVESLLDVLAERWSR